jgi:hypothetical protein
MCDIVTVSMREELKAWSAVAVVRRVSNAEVQPGIHDKLILWGINADGDSI